MSDNNHDQGRNDQQGGMGSELSFRQELRQERHLVRSAGTISKPTMALAFGIVFLLIAAGFAAAAGQWGWMVLLGGTGVASVTWAICAWIQRGRQRLM